MTEAAGVPSKRRSWNQAICDFCWYNLRGQARPVRVRPEYAELHVCAYCGDQTRSGIFIRDNPAYVKYPRWDEE